MNDFQEHTWTAEQRALDLAITSEFEGLEGAHASLDGVPDWHEACVANIEQLRSAVSALTNAKRRAHWEAELERIGVPLPPRDAPAPPTLGAETTLPPVTPAPGPADIKRAGGKK